MKMNRSRSMSVFWSAIAGGTAALLYLLLLTNQYSGDGMRWYATISGMEAVRHSGTNHLLYAPLAHGYYRFMANTGFVQGFALAQSMNALWGGVGIGAFAYLTYRLTNAWWIALSGSAALGLSRAYSVHAVDMTEPMPAMALSMVGVALCVATIDLSTPRGHLVRALVAGVAIGSAAAIYQSYIFAVVGAAGFLLVNERLTLRRRFNSVLACTGMTAAVASMLYLGTFLWFGEASTLAEAWRLSLVTENELTQGVYGEISIRRGAVWLFGLGDALYGTLRQVDTAASPAIWLRTIPGALALFSLLWLAVVVGLMTGPLVRRQVRLPARQRRVLTVCIAWLMPLVALQLYFGARYSKLWMAPLAVILIVSGVVISVVCAGGNKGRSPRIAAAAFELGLVAPIIVIGLAFNLIPDHVRSNPAVADTQAILTLTSANDLIVSTWGGLAYPSPEEPESFSLAASAFERQLSADAVAVHLTRTIRDVQSRGGSVYFYGVLDMGEYEWQPFFWDRLRLPYTLLDPYRQRAEVALTLQERAVDGREQHLWQLATESPRGSLRP